MPPAGCPRQAAERALAASRDAGDRRGEALALADLGLMHLYEGEAAQAVAILEDALALATQVGDRAWEGDTLGHLGMAATAAGQPNRGITSGRLRTLERAEFGPGRNYGCRTRT
jgi:uncharacterized protein HemY